MKQWEDDHGVSTIIATILMVAVTVVLAGVLYVMIIGMGGGSGDDVTPLGSWSDIDPTGNTTVKIEFGAISNTVEHIDIKLYLWYGDNMTEISLAAPVEAQETDCVVTGYNSDVITATFRDFDYKNGEINSGDIITVTGLQSGGYYEVEAFHIPTSSIMGMAGDDNGFQLPP